ncbi:hypothetical protein BS50DRAFT_111112 [Corynespora cassiicola Philippines]|uniref:Uncharacterized protein n=1 Tax=Corynespora cassiicola Philippines TaxID=1448308 RepID=A0A2T2NEC5_CORCC|nr:hypothetical protein BS50DRAFT_111112 [Corynespora cassiicola Philippines]
MFGSALGVRIDADSMAAALSCSSSSCCCSCCSACREHDTRPMLDPHRIPGAAPCVCQRGACRCPRTRPRTRPRVALPEPSSGVAASRPAHCPKFAIHHVQASAPGASKRPFRPNNASESKHSISKTPPREAPNQRGPRARTVPPRCLCPFCRPPTLPPRVTSSIVTVPAPTPCAPRANPVHAFFSAESMPQKGTIRALLTAGTSSPSALQMTRSVGDCRRLLSRPIASSAQRMSMDITPPYPLDTCKSLTWPCQKILFSRRLV